MPARVAESLRFLATFVRHPGSVGAILPSSRHLAERLAANLELRRGDLVLEYGPGTGPVTAVLDRLVHARTGVRYLGVELNGGFVSVLRQRYPHLDFAHGSVVDVVSLLRERGLTQARYIISGLPFASLPREVQTGTIDGIRAVLAEGGEFRTFQYVHAFRLPAARRFRRLMAEHFPRCQRSAPVVRNLPPAYVLAWCRPARAEGAAARGAAVQR
jgi:phospholipid N-methyltransferase